MAGLRNLLVLEDHILHDLEGPDQGLRHGRVEHLQAAGLDRNSAEVSRNRLEDHSDEEAGLAAAGSHRHILRSIHLHSHHRSSRSDIRRRIRSRIAGPARSRCYNERHRSRPGRSIGVGAGGSSGGRRRPCWATRLARRGSESGGVEFGRKGAAGKERLWVGRVMPATQ